VLMVFGAGKEAYKVGKRRISGERGSWKTDLAKVGAGAVGLEDFVPDAPKKNPRRRNPLTFDNRVEMTPELRQIIRDNKDRVLASILAPAKHRAIEEATENSSHNFLVVVTDKYHDNESDMLGSENAVTLLVDVKEYTELSPLRTRAKRKQEESGIFTAFTYLHRFGDAILNGVRDAFSSEKMSKDLFLTLLTAGQPDSNLLSEAFARLSACHSAFVTAKKSVGRGKAAEKMLLAYVASHVNSKMVREGYSASVGQSMADLFPLCELTPASRPLFLPFDAARMGIDRPFAASEVAACNAYGKQMNVLFREFYNALIPALYGSVWYI